jgi:hypothetical protein
LRLSRRVHSEIKSGLLINELRYGIGKKKSQTKT